jgi:uncharacterized protein with von Willebrand factor type A (vWA) domain
VRRRLQDFITALRGRGLPVSLAESLDAMQAVSVVGVERDPLREALATCLVKDEFDRPLFGELFDEYFPLVGRAGGPGRRRRPGASGAGSAAGGAGRGGGGAGAAASASRRDGPRAAAPRTSTGVRRDQPETAARPGAGQPVAAAQGTSEARGKRGRYAAVARGRAQAALLRKPFQDYGPLEIEEARALVAALAREMRGRLARRLRRARRGRIDVRRTLRRATSTGGVPIRLAARAPRPGRPDLLALCDVSGSVAAATELLLGLLAPASEYFRSVEIFVYVDRLAPAAFEGGHVIHDPGLDRHAFSDFGRVLEDLHDRRGLRLGRSTVVVILGDARNNRRPPRAALLAEIRARVGSVVWLNPEPSSRWNRGDSVMELYARHCSAVLECSSLEGLLDALGQML